MYCKSCGHQIDDKTKVCPYCKSKVGESFTDKVEEMVEEMKSPQEETLEFDSQEVANHKGLCVLAYLGIFVLIPIFSKKSTKYVRFHANQGLILLIIELIYTVLWRVGTAVIDVFSYRLGYVYSTVFQVVDILFLVFVILGLINVANGVAKRLPFIGGFNILK